MSLFPPLILGPAYSGHASLSSDETILLVDNLTTGMFDAYRFPASTPCTTFSLSSTRRFTKQCVFAEGGKVAICGSDNGRVQVVDVSSGECLQSLPLGTGQGAHQNAYHHLLIVINLNRARVDSSRCINCFGWWAVPNCGGIEQWNSRDIPLGEKSKSSKIHLAHALNHAKTTFLSSQVW